MSVKTKVAATAICAVTALGAGAPLAVAQEPQPAQQQCDQSFNQPAPGTGPEWQADQPGTGPEWQADQPGTGPEWQADQQYGPEWNSGVPCSDEQPGTTEPTPPAQQSTIERAANLFGLFGGRR